MEQPASSMLWMFPELAHFLKFVEGHRVHTWMKRFGHALPKPTVLVGNVVANLVDALASKWSRKMERKWEAMLMARLLSIPAVRFLLKRKAQYPSVMALYKRTLGWGKLKVSTFKGFCATGFLAQPRYLRSALKFRSAYKAQHQINLYYIKHRSRSQRRLQVTGKKTKVIWRLYKTLLCGSGASVGPCLQETGISLLTTTSFC